MKGTFAPWLYGSASAIRQVSLRDMALDGSLMAAGVIDNARLFNLPYVCVNFDSALWGEVAGCDINWEGDSPSVNIGGSEDPNPDTVRDAPRIQVLIEAIERVRGTLPEKKICCVIAGPATMGKYLEFGGQPSSLDQFTVSELITEYVNILCENKVDNIIITEDHTIDDSALAPWVEGSHYSRIAKLANHYSAETTLLCPNASLDESQIAEFDSLTYVIGDPNETIKATLPQSTKGLIVDNFGTGKASLPLDIESVESGTYFLTTSGDLGVTVDLAMIQKDIEVISSQLSS